MSVPTVLNEQWAEGSPDRHSERRQASSRSPSRARRATTPPSSEDADESGSAARNGRTDSTSRVTNNQRPQNNTNGQYHHMGIPSTYISSAHNRMGAVRYAEPSSDPFANQGVSTTPINEPNPQSWQRHFNEMPIQMFSSPDPITYQHLATPMLQPNRANSLPGTQISYSSMYPEKPTAIPHSAPQSYRSLPSFVQSPYVAPRGTQSTLPDSYSQQTYQQSTPAMPVNLYPSQPATERKTDAFVASDPFHPHSLAKGEKDISSFDDVETPAPLRWGSAIPQGLPGGYVGQAVNYGWPDARASDKPGGFSMPPSAPSAQGWGGGTGMAQGSNSPWRTSIYGSPYVPASPFPAESSQDAVNTQNTPIVGSNPGTINDRYDPTNYVDPAFFSSQYARDQNQSWYYTGHPSDFPARFASRPLTDKQQRKYHEPSSRISSWGTSPDDTPSARYDSIYVPPAIPSPSGWGSEFEDDLPTSPTHGGEHGPWKSALKKTIEMPVPHIPLIIPTHLPSTKYSIPGRSSATNVTHEPTGKGSGLEIGIDISPNGHLPLIPSEEAPATTIPIIPSTESPKSDLSYLPDNTIPPLPNTASDDRTKPIEQSRVEGIDHVNEQSPQVPLSPVDLSQSSTFTPALPTSQITMPIPQIPLMIPSNSPFAARPTPASDIFAHRPVSTTSSSESVAKPESLFPPNSYSPWNIPSAYPTVFPHASESSSFWSKTKNFFRWPFVNTNVPTAKPQYTPTFVPQPYVFHLPPPPPPPPVPMFVRYTKDSSVDMTKALVDFVTGTLPTQIYLHFLLRLPSLYFSRVARIFEEADLSLPEIKKMALETASNVKGPFDLQVLESSNVPLQYTRLKSTWEGFIDSVMREWKTFNIISVLLLSAILTILQIDSAADDPITRYTAIASLICALISLLFGCMYIIRFGSMRKTYKAAEWALEAKKSKTVIWWNVWVLLAMPAIWLTWSIVLYIACTMSFVWRTSSQSDAQPTVTSNTILLTVRIMISSVLGLGLIYGGLILRTFSRYGSAMDKAWKKRVDDWIVEKYGLQGHGGQYMSAPHLGSSYYHTPYMRPSTNSLPPGFTPEYQTPYNRPTMIPFIPESVSHPFAYPVRGGTPYMPPTYLPSSTPFTPMIPPTNISPYGSYPPIIPPYSPPMTPFIPSVPSTPSTPFIPPLATPRVDPMGLPYEMPPMPGNHNLRQNNAQRSYSSGIPTFNNSRRDSGDNWNYPASTRTSNERSTASSDIDSVTRTNTQNNAWFSQNFTSPNAQAPIEQPPVISNPPSTSRRYRRPSIYIPSSPPPAELSPISAIEPVHNNGALQSVDTSSPAVQNPGEPVEASRAHVRFRSPLESAASNQEGFEGIASTLNADVTISSSIIGTSSRHPIP